MKKFSDSYIHRWLVVLWVLVIFTTIATYLVTYVEITRIMEHQLMASGGSGAAITVGKLPQATGLKIRLLLLLSGSTLVIGVAGYVMVRIASRRLNRPLRIISKALSRLARGKLNETVAITEPNEYATIASGINELAANLQELLLYIWKQTGQCLEQLQQIENSIHSSEQSQRRDATLDRILKLNKALDDLRDMAKAYVFYDVHLEGGKTLATSEPGQTATSDKKRTN